MRRPPQNTHFRTDPTAARWPVMCSIPAACCGQTGSPYMNINTVAYSLGSTTGGPAMTASYTGDEPGRHRFADRSRSALAVCDKIPHHANRLACDAPGLWRCGPDLLDAPQNAVTRMQLMGATAIALAQWEPPDQPDHRQRGVFGNRRSDRRTGGTITETMTETSNTIRLRSWCANVRRFISDHSLISSRCRILKRCWLISGRLSWRPCLRNFRLLCLLRCCWNLNRWRHWLRHSPIARSICCNVSNEAVRAVLLSSALGGGSRSGRGEF